MDFELKSLSPTQAAQSALDALVVLVPDDTKAIDGKDALSGLIHGISRRGDLEAGAGKCLFIYRAAEVKATRLVLVRAGDGSDAAIRKAVTAATASVKAPGVKRLGVLLSLLPNESEAVRHAMTAVSESTYAYVTTKPSAKAREIRQVLLGVRDVPSARAGFRMGQAMVTGVELAREWANRPANHATPSHLADAARKLGRKPRIKTEVLGLKEVAALGMGAFMAVAQGSAQPLRFIVMQYQGGPKWTR